MNTHDPRITEEEEWEETVYIWNEGVSGVATALRDAAEALDEVDSGDWPDTHKVESVCKAVILLTTQLAVTSDIMEREVKDKLMVDKGALQ